MDYSYRNLVLWQKAQSLAVEVIKLTGEIPRGVSSEVLLRQVIRSASSIGENIAEGHGRFTPRAHANHISIAKGSACETDSWLDLMRRVGFISAEDERRLHVLCNELIALLTAKIRELERVQARTKVQEERAEYEVGSGHSGSRFEVLGSALSPGNELSSEEDSL